MAGGGKGAALRGQAGFNLATKGLRTGAAVAEVAAFGKIADVRDGSRDLLKPLMPVR